MHFEERTVLSPHQTVLAKAKEIGLSEGLEDKFNFSRCEMDGHNYIYAERVQRWTTMIQISLKNFVSLL